MTEVSYAESKYLGGDSSHTHLVKGLDYALLHKMRAEEGRQVSAEKGAAGSGSESEDEPRAPTALRPRRLAAPAARSPLAAAVHEFLLGSGAAAATAATGRQDRVDLFQPQRMSFEYDLEAHGALLPTATVRAKEDCPKPVARISGAADAKVLERVIKLLSYMSAGGESKVPAKKLASDPAPDPIVPAGLRVAGSLRHGAAAHETTALEETAAEQSSAPVPETAVEQAGSDEDEDIFGDAGDDYKPERRGPTAPAAPSAAAPPKRDYFGSQRGIVDLLPPLPPGSDDGYGFYDVLGGFADSDDEGGADPTLGTEDKKDQPRKAQMQRQREEAKERGKLEAELGKIRNLMEEKGHSHASAFEKRARQRAKPDQAAGLQKKRRI
ncbi:hypothetical protein QBZ16_003724 [Prototheca wickerhamii]|uniref:RED-like N-terminal domain-containing protein n=1 Tax=Prototheca wickerhamii TaxID=3111 RepID=A0AAD9IGA4_PROWI|nr:hypothetical protein QBZ16_003724 [Prototheca wickerhamii]